MERDKRTSLKQSYKTIAYPIKDNRKYKKTLKRPRANTSLKRTKRDSGFVGNFVFQIVASIFILFFFSLILKGESNTSKFIIENARIILNKSFDLDKFKTFIEKDNIFKEKTNIQEDLIKEMEEDLQEKPKK